MNKEEIEELKEFTIDLTDIDEIALGLEICSKKSNMVIQEFIDTIVQLQQENKQLKDNWNKLKEIVKSQSDFKLKIRNKELWFEVDELLSKMEELEKGDLNEKEILEKVG